MQSNKPENDDLREPARNDSRSEEHNTKETAVNLDNEDDSDKDEDENEPSAYDFGSGSGGGSAGDGGAA